MNHRTFRLTMVLLLLGTVLVSACASPPRYDQLVAGLSLPETGSLLFQGPDGNLYVIDADVRRVIAITDDAVADRSVAYTAYAWANDRVVYVRQERGSGAPSFSLLAARPGVPPTEIFRDEGLSPFFLYPSPDGSRLGYLANRMGTSGYVMQSVDLGTGNRISHGVGRPYYSAWSPTGESIITHGGLPGQRATLQIQTLSRSAVDPDRAGPRPDSVFPAARLPLVAGPFQAPAYSPDGSRIAVVLLTGEGPGIHVLDAAGRDLGRLASTRGSVAMSLAPDGRTIAYLDGTYASYGSVIGRLAIAGRHNRLVSGSATAFFWSPDSLKLVFFEPYLGRTEGRQEIMYRVGLYSVLDGQVTTMATMRPAPGFVQQIVPFFDQYARSYTIWSPDSRFVALNTRSFTGDEVVHLLDTDSVGRPHVLRASLTAHGDEHESLGLRLPDGVRAQPLAFGRNPFFSGAAGRAGD